MRAMSTGAKAGWWVLFVATVCAVLFGVGRLVEHAWVAGPVALIPAVAVAIYLNLTCNKVLGTS